MKQELACGLVMDLNSELLGSYRRVSESCDQDTALQKFMRRVPLAAFYSSSDIKRQRQCPSGQGPFNPTRPTNCVDVKLRETPVNWSALKFRTCEMESISSSMVSKLKF